MSLRVSVLLLVVAMVTVMGQRRRPSTSTTSNNEWNYRDGCKNSTLFIGLPYRRICLLKQMLPFFSGQTDDALFLEEDHYILSFLLKQKKTFLYLCI